MPEDRKPRILFVDDEDRILDALKRMLRGHRHEWDMAFVEGGKEALVAMAEHAFDVIVSDMRMPSMDGAELLQEIEATYPSTIRFILSGHADREMILRTVGPTHRFFSKPCQPDVLVKAISQAVATLETMRTKNVQSVVSGAVSLPSPPEIYEEVRLLVTGPEVPVEELANVIGRDVAMTVEILRIVNSSFFGPSREVGNVSEALKYLGGETVKAIVLRSGVLQALPRDLSEEFRLSELDRHSTVVGIMAGKLIKTMTDSNINMIDNAMMAGFLHDIGKLVFVANATEQYREMLKRSSGQGRSLGEVETQIMGTTHADVGGYLVELWGLPSSIVEAISCHHQPRESLTGGFSLVTAVHIADGFEHEMMGNGETGAVAIDRDYLEGLEVLGKLDELREMVC